MPPKKRTAEQDPAVRRKRGKKRKSASNGDFSDEEAAGSDNEKAPEPEEVYDESRPKIVSLFNMTPDPFNRDAFY